MYTLLHSTVMSAVHHLGTCGPGSPTSLNEWYAKRLSFDICSKGKEAMKEQEMAPSMCNFYASDKCTDDLTERCPFDTPVLRESVIWCAAMSSL